MNNTFFLFCLKIVVTGYISCNFESVNDRTCGFKNNASNNVDWELKTGNTQNSFTGPLADHTTNTNAGR